MPNQQKTVFISYRRKVNLDLAERIRDHLQKLGYDVFLDIKSLRSGKWKKNILEQLAGRFHFLLLLEKGTLNRCKDPNDFLLREIKSALIKDRNIIPILVDGYSIDKAGKHL